MSHPVAWVAAWRVIDAVTSALIDAGRCAPQRCEVGSGGPDFTLPDCCEAVLVDIEPAQPPTAQGGNMALPYTLHLYMLRDCVARGADPQTGGRLAESGGMPIGGEECDWEPREGTWHGDQLGLLRDLDAIWSAARQVGVPRCGDLLPCTVATAGRPAAYRTATQGRCQGWRIPYALLPC